MSYFKSITQDVKSDDNNSSTSNVNSGSLFIGSPTSTLGVAGIQVSLKTNKNCIIYVDQAPSTSLVTAAGTGAANNSTTLTGTNTMFSREFHEGDTIVFDSGGTPQTRIVQSIESDTSLTVTSAFTGGSLSGKTVQHYPWDISDAYEYYASINNFGITVQAINSYVRVRVKNTSSSNTDYFRLQTALCPIVEALPRSLDEDGHLKVKVEHISDEYGFEVENTPMGEMRVVRPTKLAGTTFEGPTIDTNFWIATNTNGGTATQSSATIALATNTTANGASLINSVRKARYTAGSSMCYRSTVRFNDTGTANNKRRFGIGLVANYNITISSATVVAGDIYTNNSQQFTVLQSGTVTNLVAEGTGNPGAGAQTYTRVAGTGPATLTGSAFAVGNTITDGAYFQLNGTTFSCVINKRGVETPIDNGSFNGELGATYSPTTSATVYEIYWTNSKVYFSVGGKTLHVFSADTTAWTSSMNMNIFSDNTNSAGSTTNVILYIRVASIRRLGDLLTQPTSKYQSGTTAGVVCKYGPGNLHRLVLGECPTSGSVITLYDAITAAGNKIAQFTIAFPGGGNFNPQVIDFGGLPFFNGLTLVIATQSSTVTVVYE